MACAAPSSSLPVTSLSARRRSTTAAYHYPTLSRLSRLPSGNAPRAPRLRAEASKADPVEEGLPAAPAPAAPSEPLPRAHTSTWNWKGYNIRYQYAGTSGPALVLIHGFGANSNHWRKNIPVLAMANRVYAIDLIGYGYSDKPNPRGFEESFYTFETWGEQLNTFCAEVVKSDAFFICNSIGDENVAGVYEEGEYLEPQDQDFENFEEPDFEEPYVEEEFGDVYAN